MSRPPCLLCDDERVYPAGPTHDPRETGLCATHRFRWRLATLGDPTLDFEDWTCATLRDDAHEAFNDHLARGAERLRHLLTIGA